MVCTPSVFCQEYHLGRICHVGAFTAIGRVLSMASPDLSLLILHIMGIFVLAIKWAVRDTFIWQKSDVHLDVEALRYKCTLNGRSSVDLGILENQVLAGCWSSLVTPIFVRFLGPCGTQQSFFFFWFVICFCARFTTLYCF